MKRRTQQGQVLLLAVAVLLVLTTAALVLFDFHNVLRAKIKVESAQQAAALAGAQWQVIGLNMLGDINLLKATTLMTAESEDIPSFPLQKTRLDFKSDAEYEKAKKKQRLNSRLKTLSETQSRLSFIVPLLGVMAIQETARQNGMTNDTGVIQQYLSNLDSREKPEVQGFSWESPYRSLLGQITNKKNPMRCNARVSELPEVWSNKAGSRTLSGGSADFQLLLSRHELYSAIDSGNYCYWQLRKMVKAGVYLQSPWWQIGPLSMGNFIEECELMPLGVSFGGGTDVQTLLDKKRISGAAPAGDWNVEEEFQPDLWCKYDDRWYSSSFTAEDYSEQQSNWNGRGWLRNDRKSGFLYEGPVCAVDCATNITRSMNFRFNKQKADKAISYRDPVSKRNVQTVTVGRTSTGNGEILGVVAKVLGGFNNLSDTDDNPTATPVILPVFTRGLLIPSSMPYNVEMLTDGDNTLKKFLKWLATNPDIETAEPPSGTETFLLLLKKLMDPEFIRKGWNPDFAGLESWDMMRILSNDYCYPEYSNGAGWLQQAYTARAPICPQKVVYTGKKDKNGEWVTKLEPAVPDNTVTELPQSYVDDKGVTQKYYSDYSGITRVYYGTEKNGYRYLLKKNGKIQTNEDISCDGSLYSGTGGTIRHGKESGPSRL